ncbi:hypothetical protein TELCIR_16778 [Teladorsagia circumcincta]|uniref:MER3 helicase-like winged helix domain-containing protein n=1 Tax=Teladorsagia circumcincta TaxID=45464 RepID=A0A2G9TUK3_TELCI|nr:hypothetical protein TELCIR_16778 [Teladorsagia circumcincta]
MNEVCYDEVLSYVKKGHQVLVFVHARNATASLAQAFRERAAQLVCRVHLHLIGDLELERNWSSLRSDESLGTVSNVAEAVEWLTYTYYYTRATQNPIAYGLPHMVLDKDPDLRHHLTRMVTDVAVKLDQNQMIRFDSV